MPLNLSSFRTLRFPKKLNELSHIKLCRLLLIIFMTCTIMIIIIPTLSHSTPNHRQGFRASKFKLVENFDQIFQIFALFSPPDINYLMFNINLKLYVLEHVRVMNCGAWNSLEFELQHCWRHPNLTLLLNLDCTEYFPAVMNWIVPSIMRLNDQFKSRWQHALICVVFILLNVLFFELLGNEMGPEKKQKLNLAQLRRHYQFCISNEGKSDFSNNVLSFSTSLCVYRPCKVADTSCRGCYLGGRSRKGFTRVIFTELN